MYCTVQTIGNLDVDTMNRYQVAKRKGSRIIQKCNELLDAIKKETDSRPEKSNRLSAEKTPEKHTKSLV